MSEQGKRENRENRENFRLPMPLAAAFTTLRPEMFDIAIAELSQEPMSAENVRELLRFVKSLAMEVHDGRQRQQTLEREFKNIVRSVEGVHRRLGEMIGGAAKDAIADEEEI